MECHSILTSKVTFHIYLAYARVGICLPTGGVWHKEFFRWVWAQARRRPDTPGIPKNVSGLVDIPLKRRASGARQWKGLSLGGRHPEARGCRSKRTSTGCQASQNTPDQIRVPTNTADRSVSQPGDIQRLCIHTCLSSFVRPLSNPSIYPSLLVTWTPLGTIHFNTCVCWLEIRVHITRVAIGTFFYVTDRLLKKRS